LRTSVFKQNEAVERSQGRTISDPHTHFGLANLRSLDAAVTPLHRREASKESTALMNVVISVEKGMED
jgi:hypothetical protein